MNNKINYQGAELLSSANRIIRALDKHSKVSKRQVVKVITDAYTYLQGSSKAVLARKMESLLAIVAPVGCTARRLQGVMEQVKRTLASAVRTQKPSCGYDRNMYKFNLKDYSLC